MIDCRRAMSGGRERDVSCGREGEETEERGEVGCIYPADVLRHGVVGGLLRDVGNSVCRL